MNDIALVVFLFVAGLAAVLYWISPGEHKMPSRHTAASPPPHPFHTAPPPHPPRAEPAGGRFDHEHLPAAIVEALERGGVVEAIKRLRELKGVGLPEAKAIVDELRRRRSSHGFGADAPHGAATHVSQAVLEAIDRGETILAIKRHREATGVGLAEAKAIVDAIRRRHP